MQAFVVFFFINMLMLYMGVDLMKLVACVQGGYSYLLLSCGLLGLGLC